MRITEEDSSMVNWEAVKDKLAEEAGQATIDGIEEAQRVLSQLKPGQRKTIGVRVASITVARPK